MSVHCSLIKTTLVDYPERVAAACFVGGCNLRCPYCYNVELVREKGTVRRVQSESLTPYPLPLNPDTVSYDEIITHLKKRRNVLTGFVISGGEPLLHYDFTVELIRAARALDYKIKLDTNGTFPDRLENLINDRALRPDYIALDVKTAPARYGVLSEKGTVRRVQETVRREQGTVDSELAPYPLPLTPENPLPLTPASASASVSDSVCKSIKLLSSLPPNAREFRTVLYPPLVGRQEISAIASVLPKDAAWYFAQFHNEHCLSKEAEKIPPYTDAEIKELVDYAKSLVSGASLR